MFKHVEAFVMVTNDSYKTIFPYQFLLLTKC